MLSRVLSFVGGGIACTVAWYTSTEGLFVIAILVVVAIALSVGVTSRVVQQRYTSEHFGLWFWVGAVSGGAAIFVAYNSYYGWDDPKLASGAIFIAMIAIVSGAIGAAILGILAWAQGRIRSRL